MKNKILIYLSLIALIIIFGLTLPDNKPKVVVCDVGQGDAILATYKNIQILVDVGPNNKKVLKCLENNLPFWDKKIEVVILTHGDSDHVGALDDLLRSYKVDQFFSNGYLDEEIEQKIYSRKSSQNDIVSLSIFTFEVVWPEENVRSEAIDKPQFLADKDGNENSVAGILSILLTSSGQNWRMFLTGDMESEAEQKLVWREVLDKPVEVLKVSHHGSNTGTSDELLDVLKPKMAVISVGKNNRFGHPTEEILEKLKLFGAKIRRTDLEGEIEVFRAGY